jgi:hypothetical protein
MTHMNENEQQHLVETDFETDRGSRRKMARLLLLFPSSLLDTEHVRIIREMNTIEAIESSYTNDESESLQHTSDSVNPSPHRPFENSEEVPSNNYDKTSLINKAVDIMRTEDKDQAKLKFANIKQFLITVSNDASLEKDHEIKFIGADINFNESDNVRGLAASAIIYLYSKTGDLDLIKHIRRLSIDHVNVVRALVCLNLMSLKSSSSLFQNILQKYSTDEDLGVVMCLANVMDQIISVHNIEFSSILRKLFHNIRESESYLGDGLIAKIVTYAIKDGSSEYFTLLNHLIVSKLVVPKVKRTICFHLKEMLLHEPHESVAIKMYSKLVKDPDAEVREKSSFFLLNTIETKITSNEMPGYRIKKILNKMQPALNKLGKEILQEGFHPKIIEELISFLVAFWIYIPDKSLLYLDYFLQVSSLCLPVPHYQRPKSKANEKLLSFTSIGIMYSK